MRGAKALALETDGAQWFPSLLGQATLDSLTEHLDPSLGDKPGKRIVHGQWLSLLEPKGVIGQLVSGLTNSIMRPVRCVYFDKTLKTNWAVGWHQDRTIAVVSKQDVDGFGPWSLKDGIVHVEPPTSLLASMITIRVHLDPCSHDNAPLIVALGSHHFGLVPADKAALLADGCEPHICLAEAGDVWAYKTLILHKSQKTNSSQRRRVLQIDFSNADLPGGLEFRGLDQF